MLKELWHLYKQQALLPLKQDGMSYDDRKKDLWYFIFIKEKRDSTIKARDNVNGRPQSEYINKKDTSSHTASI